MSENPLFPLHGLQFRKTLINWHRQENDRQMPWKGEKNAYRIWLSEIILQQTRVEQGLDYYNRFITHFPTITDLAAAPDDAVMKLWEGLGYYSRCRNLIATARYIVKHHNGQFPDNYEDIISLKGVGPYTAAAIASFGFSLPHAVVDGNVYRVLSRVFGIDTPTDSTGGKKYFADLAQLLLDPQNPGEYNQGIMDFGATVCKPQSPLCGNCVFNDICEARKQNLIDQLPVKTKKLSIRARHFNYFLIRKGAKMLIRQRREKDIWQDLYEFPLLESDSVAIGNKPAAFLEKKLGMRKDSFQITQTSSCYIRHLTHQTIKAVFFHVQLDDTATVPHLGFSWVTDEELKKLAFPRLLRDYLEREVGIKSK